MHQKRHRVGHKTMIENISIDTPLFDYDERGFLNKEILKTASPFFNIDFYNDSQEDKVQWFYNLMYVARDIDLGLAHALQHNQVARTHVISCDNAELKDKVLGVPFYETIGSTADWKPSDTVKLHNNILYGSKNWLTNLSVASYVALYATNDDNMQTKVVIDLDKAPHTKEVDFPNTMGMGMAKPFNIHIDEYYVPKGCVLGINGWPDRSFVEESFKHLSFLSTLIGITQALFNEVYNSAKTRKLHNDFSVIKAKLDVFTATSNWIDMMASLIDEEVRATEQWWIKKEYYYLFGKKTLLSVINLSRELCVPQHILHEGDASKVFRHAVSFSSHMRRFEHLQNPWGDKDDKEIDLNAFIDLHINKLINKNDLPETMIRGFDYKQFNKDEA